jgi:hypothetical protein
MNRHRVVGYARVLCLASFRVRRKTLSAGVNVIMQRVELSADRPVTVLVVIVAR